MANAEVLVRSILGAIRSDIRPLALAVDITDGLLFHRRIPMDDIQITKQVYPGVAKLIHRTPEAASRQIERLAHLCWDAMEEQDLVVRYLGRAVKYAPTPRDLIVSLAVYVHLKIPITVAVEQENSLLFSPSLRPDQLVAGSLDQATVDALLRSRPLPVTQTMVFPAASDRSGYPVCPNCRVTLEREYQSYCDRCGQHLDWSRYEAAEIIYPEAVQA